MWDEADYVPNSCVRHFSYRTLTPPGEHILVRNNRLAVRAVRGLWNLEPACFFGLIEKRKQLRTSSLEQVAFSGPWQNPL